MLYYTTDEFVYVLPSAIMECGNKSHQRLLAFVLAKVQVTASTGKRGKYNITKYSILSLFSMPNIHVFYFMKAILGLIFRNSSISAEELKYSILELFK